MLIVALFIITQIWKQPKMISTVGLINTLWYYLYNEIDTARSE